jgi:hypothetical protein
LKGPWLTIATCYQQFAEWQTPSVPGSVPSIAKGCSGAPTKCIYSEGCTTSGKIAIKEFFRDMKLSRQNNSGKRVVVSIDYI